MVVCDDGDNENGWIGRIDFLLFFVFVCNAKTHKDRKLRDVKQTKRLGKKYSPYKEGRIATMARKRVLSALVKIFES